jgi:hypothetical protein
MRRAAHFFGGLFLWWAVSLVGRFVPNRPISNLLFPAPSSQFPVPSSQLLKLLQIPANSLTELERFDSDDAFEVLDAVLAGVFSKWRARGSVV